MLKKFTQKMEVKRLLLKIHICMGYPPLGEIFVEMWVVDKKNQNQQCEGLKKTFQKLYGYPYSDD
jgi:hypothetical protein